jgi:hypothetical protein
MSLPSAAETANRRITTYPARAAFLVAAGTIVLLAHVVDVIDAGGPNWPALEVRLLWSALLFVGAAILRRGNAHNIRILGRVACAGSALAGLLLLFVTGRSQSPLIPFIGVLVATLPAVTFERMATAVLSSAALVIGVGLMILADGASPNALIAWTHTGIIALGIGTMLGIAYDRAMRTAEQQWLTLRETLERLKEAHASNETLVAELREALSNVKTLGGLLPVCAWCRRVRNDEGYWQQLELFLQAHSETRISHGVCPECMKREFPEMDDQRPAGA